MTELDIKARELIIKFQFQNPALHFDVAKNLAFICIDEEIDLLKKLDEKWHKPEDVKMTSFFVYEIEELETIKKIIEKL